VIKSCKNREHQIDSSVAFEFALLYNISVYDAHFVVLAEQMETWLITEDIEVLKKCPKTAMSMVTYTNLIEKNETNS
jgi:predicted nucleic acid-binding protein